MKKLSPLLKLLSIIILIGALIYIYDAFVKSSCCDRVTVCPCIRWHE